MSLQQFLELADCRVGLTQWSRQTVPEYGSSDLEGPVTEACVSARDHTDERSRRRPTSEMLAVIGQRCWTIQRIPCYTYSLCPFNGHFPRWTWVSQYQNVSILDLVGAKDDGGCGDNCSYKTCKALVKLLPSTNQHPVFFTGMPFLSANLQCQSTEGKHIYVP